MGLLASCLVSKGNCVGLADPSSVGYVLNKSKKDIYTLHANIHVV